MKRYRNFPNILASSTNRLPNNSESPKSSQSDSLPKIKIPRSSSRIGFENQKSHFIEGTASSNKSCGYVYRYAVNTLPGLVRPYNEDRVSIIINIPCPAGFNSEKWPRSSFYGIFDGHGGKLCANYLKDNLHNYIFKDENFPTRPKQALINGFLKAEENFLRLAEQKRDMSGSCALVVVIIGDKCYTANTGDSRAVLSINKGEQVVPLTVDHKPNEPNEFARIIEAGGSVNTHSYPIINHLGVKIGENCSRVVPGNLAISRTIGDLDVKNLKVVIPDPDVKSFRLKEEYDFIILASDGIFDKLSDKDVVECAWKALRSNIKSRERAVGVVEEIIETSFRRNTQDNVSVIFIGLRGIKEIINKII